MSEQEKLSGLEDNLEETPDQKNMSDKLKKITENAESSSSDQKQEKQETGGIESANNFEELYDALKRIEYAEEKYVMEKLPGGGEIIGKGEIVKVNADEIIKRIEKLKNYKKIKMKHTFIHTISKTEILDKKLEELFQKEEEE